MCLENAGLLIEGVSETVENEGKEQKEDFQVCWSLVY